MSLDTTAFDAALKDVYLPGIREELNEKTNLLDLFTEGDLTQYEWLGRRLVFALHSSRNYSGVKYVPENGGLPVAGNQGTKNLFIPIAHLKGRIQLSYEVIRASRSDKGAFVRAMDLEQKGLVNDVSRQRNRALAGYGSEVLAVITTGASNNTTQTIKNPGGVAGTTNPGRFIKPGMILAFSDPTGATINAVMPTVVSVSGSSLVLSAAITTTTNDIITLGTNSLGTNETSFNDASMGILGIVDSTTYVTTIFGLDRSTTANAFFRSQVFASTGTISADVLQRGIDNVEEVSWETIDRFVCHSSVRREIAKLTEADRRYAAGSSPMNFDAGTQAGAYKKDLTFNSWSFRTDKDFAYGTLCGVNSSHLQWLPETKGEWADEDGTVLLRVANKDAYEARFRVSENYATDKGNSHIRFDGITANVSSGVYSD
jgi:hypothetical protein